MKILVNGKEYTPFAMTNPKVLPLSMADKQAQWFLYGKRGVAYTLTLWKNNVYSLCDSAGRYQDFCNVQEVA